MSTLKVVSFVIPARNAADTLEYCIKSIFNQNFPSDKMEVFVVDNGSADETVALAKSLGAKAIVNDQRVTIAALRNMGARASSGDFIAFIDSDMILPPHWLKAALEILNDETIGMTGAKTHLFPENAPWVQKTWNLHLDRDKCARDVTWLNGRAIMVKANAYRDVGGFDDSLEVCEDADFAYRIHKKVRIVSDQKLIAMHLKEARTLPEFFKKEAWRGKDSVRVSLMRIRDGEWRELMSLAQLCYYLILFVLLIPALAASVILRTAVYGLVVVTAIALPILLLSIDTCRKAKSFSMFWKLCVVYLAYMSARAWSVVIWKK